MKRLLGILGAAALLLVPVAVYAQYEAKGKAPSPVEQTLVREGEFAVKLAGALGLGRPGSEAEAEDMLAGAGIAPKNGWLADYPVTPDILTELRDATAEAAGKGRLGLGREEADKRFVKLAGELKLAITAGGDTGYAEGSSELEYGEYESERAYDYGEYSEPVVIEHYYYDYGPPVITYYAPPWDYYYLYTWVPYPFWWYGWWYGGYYILCDFHVTVNVTVTDGTTTTAVVTNHAASASTGTVSVVDPVARRTGKNFLVSADTLKGRSAIRAERSRAGSRSILTRDTERSRGSWAERRGTRSSSGGVEVIRGTERPRGNPTLGRGSDRPRVSSGGDTVRRGIGREQRPSASERTYFGRGSSDVTRGGGFGGGGATRPSISSGGSSGSMGRSSSAPSGGGGSMGRSFSAPSGAGGGSMGGGGGGRSFSAPGNAGGGSPGSQGRGQGGGCRGGRC